LVCAICIADYLAKPCKFTELADAIARAYENKTLRRKNVVLEDLRFGIGTY
jgi:FixJ family two-component response regulator